MLIIIDSRLPQEAKDSLKEFGDVFELQSKDIVYHSIQGHPDIFLLQMENLVMIAPNAPLDLKETLKKHRIPFLIGKAKLGDKFPETAHYNAVSTPDYLIHREGFTDSCILCQNEKKQFVHVNQAYTRCNLLSLSDGSFITSDKGIEKALSEKNIEVHYFSSEDVLLDGQEYGFIGGTMGVYHNKIFIIGSLAYYHEGDRLRNILSSKNMEIIELYNGPLIDGGGVFFLES
jgi:hypothetical protein